MKVTGTPVSPGIAIAPAYYYRPFSPNIVHTKIDETQFTEQLQDYTRAWEQAKQELQDAISTCQGKDERKDILLAHLDILSDETLDEMIRSLIIQEHMSADWAIANAFDSFIQTLAEMDDPLIKERVADLTDIKNRVLRCYQGEAALDFASFPEPVIICAYELLPSDTATFDKRKILGIISEKGSYTSHTAILARSYGIPAVLGVPRFCETIQNGMEIILDGGTGTIIIDPSAEERAYYEEQSVRYQKEITLTNQFLKTEPLTADGHHICVELNIGSAQDNALELAPYVDGVGLFRTEFLYMQGDKLPSEEMQYQTYAEVLQHFPNKPVILRTLDIGGDKTLACMDLPHEDNPFLGKRALRLCMERQDIFETQLRAMLRASIHGMLYIMFPMVGSMDDFGWAKHFLLRIAAQLRQEGIPVSEQIKIGAMIEIPAIALISDRLAEEADFASVGTNDLCQYLTATDRMNAEVAAFYQSYHPAVFRILHIIGRAFQRHGKLAAVCGEMGGDPLAIPALLGCGIRALSMNPASVARAKQVLAGISLGDAEKLASEVKDMYTASEVQERLQKFYDRRH